MNTLSIQHDDGIVTVTVDRPAKLNALSEQTLTELRDFFAAPPAASGILLTGAGEKAFVAGADIREMAAMDPDTAEKYGRLGQQVTTLIEQTPVPVIACVNGYALGGGCELAMGCDFIYATEQAVFGQPEVSLGLLPGFGGCVRLQRRVGPGWAKELIYTGRKLTAAQAQRIGLVNTVFADRQAMLTAAAGTLREIDANSPVAVTLCKSAIDAAYGIPTGRALDLEAAAFRETFTSEDMREGTTAFLAKRPAVFPGR
jgi:enoyl-CoA hydratase